MRHPESVEECLYFTRRKLDERGKAMAWAFRKECPQCHQALMKKPNKRAKEYVCPACGYSEPKEEHEAGVKIFVEYVCPYCGHAGETTIPYKRKTWHGVKAYVFHCANCKEKIGLTKKMAEPKKKAGPKSPA